MGWGRYFLLGDLGQQLDLQDLRRTLQQQDSRDRGQELDIKMLARENQQLKLAVTAIANLLIRKGVVTKEELSQVAEAIDM